LSRIIRGTINVRNAPPGGARFEIWLPEHDDRNALPVGRGERVLLLADPETLDADEEWVAGLGYEPIGLSLTAEDETIVQALPLVDGVIVSTAGVDPSQRLSRLGEALSGKRLLVCSGGQTGSIANGLRWLPLDLSQDGRTVLAGQER
jgi:hypothetical protein